MDTIENFYIEGRFATSRGRERLALVNPVTGAPLGHVVLANEDDANAAVASAAAAQDALARTTPAQRIAMLRRLHAAVLRRADELRDATILEYGGPVSRSSWVASFAASTFLDAAKTLQDFAFERRAGDSTVRLEPVGVSVLVTPWNSSAGSVCSKLAMALAAGCASVIKPSELSARQTRILVEAFHEADLPPGAVNVLDGLGHVVGPVLCRHPDVARISFTGSNATGLAIARLALDSMKRVTLGLGGKSPAVVLDDADFARAIPTAVDAAFQNSGQACIAASRLLVPRQRMAEVAMRIRRHVDGLVVGAPHDPATVIGPMASAAQFERIQRYIAAGLAEGATLLAGGPGRPSGLHRGFFVRPTVFTDVDNGMTIAREEIFGPVLCVIAYDDEDDAVRLANDTPFGLHAYVFSGSDERAWSVARRLRAGRVAINGFRHDPLAPFGGYKASGIGREYGVAGLESFLETKAILQVA